MRKFRVNHHYKLSDDIVKVIKRDVWKPDTENKPYIRCRVVHVVEKERSNPLWPNYFAFYVGFEFDLFITTQFYTGGSSHVGPQDECAYPIAGTPSAFLKAKDKTRKPQTTETA